MIRREGGRDACAEPGKRTRVNFGFHHAGITELSVVQARLRKMVVNQTGASF